MDGDGLYDDIDQILGHAAEGQDISSNDLELTGADPTYDAGSATQSRRSKQRRQEAAEQAAGFLLQEGMLLSALELHQEIREQAGPDALEIIPALSDVFDNDDQLVQLSQQADAAEAAAERQLLESVASGGQHPDLLAVAKVKSPFSSGGLESSLESRQQRIALLEYKLRAAERDKKRLQKRLQASERAASQSRASAPQHAQSAAAQGMSKGAPSNEPSSAASTSSSQPAPEAAPPPTGPPSGDEQRALDQLVHSYLVGSGRELAAASFVDEAGVRPLPAGGVGAEEGGGSSGGRAGDLSPAAAAMQQACRAGLVAVFRGAVKPSEEAARAAAEAGSMKQELEQLRRRVQRAEQLAEAAAEERRTWTDRQHRAVEDAAARATAETRKKTQRSILEKIRSEGLKSVGLSAADVPDAEPAEDLGGAGGGSGTGTRLQDLALVESFEADGLLVGTDAIVRAADGGASRRRQRLRRRRSSGGDEDEFELQGQGTGVHGSTVSAAMRIVRLLASTVPELSKHVVTRHRALLFPLYAATAAAHPSASDRRALVSGLLTSVKRPRPHERAGILRQLSSLARASTKARTPASASAAASAAGPGASSGSGGSSVRSSQTSTHGRDQIDLQSDILPQVLASTSMGTRERRAVAAQGCGVLAVHVGARSCDPLLATLAMLADDKSGVVRRAVVRGAACMARCLLEKDEKVQDALRAIEAKEGGVKINSDEAKEEEEEPEKTDGEKDAEGSTGKTEADGPTTGEDSDAGAGADTGGAGADTGGADAEESKEAEEEEEEYGGMSAAEARAEQQAIARQFQELGDLLWKFLSGEADGSANPAMLADGQGIGLPGVGSSGADGAEEGEDEPDDDLREEQAIDAAVKGASAAVGWATAQAVHAGEEAARLVANGPVVAGLQGSKGAGMVGSRAGRSPAASSQELQSSMRPSVLAAEQLLPAMLAWAHRRGAMWHSQGVLATLVSHIEDAARVACADGGGSLGAGAVGRDGSAGRSRASTAASEMDGETAEQASGHAQLLLGALSTAFGPVRRYVLLGGFRAAAVVRDVGDVGDESGAGTPGVTDDAGKFEYFLSKERPPDDVALALLPTAGDLGPQERLKYIKARAGAMADSLACLLRGTAVLWRRERGADGALWRPARSSGELRRWGVTVQWPSLRWMVRRVVCPLLRVASVVPNATTSHRALREAMAGTFRCLADSFGTSFTARAVLPVVAASLGLPVERVGASAASGSGRRAASGSGVAPTEAADVSWALMHHVLLAGSEEAGGGGSGGAGVGASGEGQGRSSAPDLALDETPSGALGKAHFGGGHGVFGLGQVDAVGVQSADRVAGSDGPGWPSALPECAWMRKAGARPKRSGRPSTSAAGGAAADSSVPPLGEESMGGAWHADALLPVLGGGILAAPCLPKSMQQQVVRELLVRLAMEKEGWTRSQLPRVEDCIARICAPVAVLWDQLQDGDREDKQGDQSADGKTGSGKQKGSGGTASAGDDEPQRMALAAAASAQIAGIGVRVGGGLGLKRFGATPQLMAQPAARKAALSACKRVATQVLQLLQRVSTNRDPSTRKVVASLLHGLIAVLPAELLVSHYLPTLEGLCGETEKDESVRLAALRALGGAYSAAAPAVVLDRVGACMRDLLASGPVRVVVEALRLIMRSVPDARRDLRDGFLLDRLLEVSRGVAEASRAGREAMEQICGAIGDDDGRQDDVSRAAEDAAVQARDAAVMAAEPWSGAKWEELEEAAMACLEALRMYQTAVVRGDMPAECVDLWRQAVKSLLDEPGLLDAAYGQGYRAQVHEALTGAGGGAAAGLDQAPALNGSSGSAGASAKARGQGMDGMAVGMSGYGSTVGTPATAPRSTGGAAPSTGGRSAGGTPIVGSGSSGGDGVSDSGQKPPVARSLAAFLGKQPPAVQGGGVSGASGLPAEDGEMGASGGAEGAPGGKKGFFSRLGSRMFGRGGDGDQAKPGT